MFLCINDSALMLIKCTYRPKGENGLYYCEEQQLNILVQYYVFHREKRITYDCLQYVLSSDLGSVVHFFPQPFTFLIAYHLAWRFRKLIQKIFKRRGSKCRLSKPYFFYRNSVWSVVVFRVVMLFVPKHSLLLWINFTFLL